FILPFFLSPFPTSNLALAATLLLLVFFMESGVLIGTSFLMQSPLIGIVSVITFITCYLNRTHYLPTSRHNPFHHITSKKKTSITLYSDYSIDRFPLASPRLSKYRRPLSLSRCLFTFHSKHWR
ncbi:hypothetical protein BDC45DRAFT_523069, partial [Circinella umbellata]